jgi:ribosome biogenesis GTPase
MEEYRIIKALSGFYYVQTEDGVVECRARGRFRRQDQSPLVGDFVRITRQGDKGVLEELLPRKNAFIRPAVANIDQLVVLASCAIPVTEPFLIDRVLAIAQMQGVPALVVVNKDDLASAQPLAEIYRKAGVPVLVTSAETGEGIEALREALNGKLSCLTGNSGVGKSSLLNRACPQLQLPVGEVSEKLGRGRHTTRHVELFALGGGTYVIDTPGFSSFDTEEMDLELKAHLPETFPEFAPYVDQCRFTGCTHTKEKGCRVLQAVKDGDIPASRHRSYLRLYDELKDLRAWQKK